MTQKKETKLLPCPWCETCAIMFSRRIYNEEVGDSCFCASCGASGPFCQSDKPSVTWDKAIAAWNKRVEGKKK